MVQGYYTLQEAADYLDMSLDELKQMAQKGKIRSFQDRGTLRFRIQDIQELGRSRGTASEPELVLGDASLTPPKSAPMPSSGKRKAPASPKSPAKQSTPEVFAFDLDDSVDLGSDVVLPKSDVKSKVSSKSSKRPNSPPIPSAGSDSDVRLVADGSEVTFSLPKDAGNVADSDVKISPDPLKPRTAPSSAKRKSQIAAESGPKSKPSAASSGTKPTTPKPGSGQLPVDSGVRLVPLSDSDVKLMGSSDDVPLGGDGSQSGTTDSNVRLEKVKIPPADSHEGMMLTEEINLDEELRKQQEKERTAAKGVSKLKPKSELKMPTASPFELSDSDLEMPPELKQRSGPKTPAKPTAPQNDSSDFDLESQSPVEDGSSDFDLLPSKEGVQLQGDSNDFSLELAGSSEGVLDDERSTELTNSTSGISLDNPVDQGISLEDGASDDFDLSLEVEDTPKPSKSRPIEDSESDFEIGAHKTPRPGKHQEFEDSASDFDLSLESDLAVPTADDDSSFDLNLDGSGELVGDSDSEFELTLDDSGNLALDDDAAPQIKKKGRQSTEEPDIFETDFEVPALDGSDEATMADGELESSEFDLALEDSDLAPEEESGSQVVALDEEEADTVVDAEGDAAVVDDVEVEEESSDFADLDQDVEVEVEGDEPSTLGQGKVRVKTVVQERMIEPAQWGIMPVIFMLPCVIVMFVVALLGYELVQTTTTLKPPGPLTVGIAGLIGQEIKVK
jgi:excisionase family DNA binding protein